jgi:outer membrane protein OmpU
MKKILLATSAVALFAGAAAAEVTTTGTARMGITYVDNGATTTTQFSSRIRIIFTASGESDSGFTFGGSVRNDQSGVGNTGNGDSTVFIAGAFGKLTMGDVSGAADSLVGQTSGVGYGPFDGAQEIGFIGAGKTAIYYEYSAGAFTLGVGSGQLETAVDTASIGGKYSTDAYSFALAYEQSNSANPVFDFSMISASASAKLGAATLKARVSDKDVAGQDLSWSVSADYAVGATTLTAFYTDFGNNTGLSVAGGNDLTPAASTGTTHIGIGASYDLGGGATVAGGIIRQNNTGVADATIADVGLKFAF